MRPVDRAFPHGAWLACLMSAACTRRPTVADVSAPPPVRLTQPDAGAPAQPVPSTGRPNADSSAMPPAPTEPAALSAAGRASNALGAALWSQLRNNPGNLVVSPVSVALALGMTTAGARGETAAQMRRVLGQAAGGLSDAQADAALGALSRSLDAPGGGSGTPADPHGVQIATANRLYGQAGWPFESAFLDFTRTAYAAPLEPVDFEHAAEAQRTRINAWVLERTRQRIRDLIPPRGITEDTRLVLVNALYFLGAWADAFQEGATQPQAFHVDGGAPRPVPTMRRTGQYGLARREGYRVLEMPYADHRFSMLIVLPDALNGLAAIEGRMDATMLDQGFTTQGGTRVSLSLPRFKCTSDSMQLGPALRSLGMRLAFDPQRADFTGIAPVRTPEDRLAISEVFHKTFVDVNERGTEAAAATAVVMMRATAFLQEPDPVPFVVDRPFLFVLRDRQSGAALFVGRITDPARER